MSIHYVIRNEICTLDQNRQIAANQIQNMQTPQILLPRILLPISELNINSSITVQSCICHTPAYTAAGAGNLRVWGAGTNGNKTFRGTSAR